MFVGRGREDELARGGDPDPFDVLLVADGEVDGLRLDQLQSTGVVFFYPFVDSQLEGRMGNGRRRTTLLSLFMWRTTLFESGAQATLVAVSKSRT